MREELEKLIGVRLTFTATVSRFGTTTGFTGKEESTICLTNVSDSDGKILTDHIWFSVGKTIANLKLLENEKIKFDARVSGYWKGYRKEDFDYKLNNITNLERIL